MLLIKNKKTSDVLTIKSDQQQHNYKLKDKMTAVHVQHFNMNSDNFVRNRGRASDKVNITFSDLDEGFVFDHKFGFATPSCIYYQLDISESQNYGKHMARSTLFILSDNLTFDI